MATTIRRSNGASPLPSKLAQQILTYIADSRVEQGTHLGEVRLAESLKVSRTPVRAALEFLAEMGVVEKRPNRGFFVKSDSRSLVAKPIAENEPEDLIYHRIVEDRLSGNLPERVSELELIRRYGITKSLLAGLLRQMSQEGWIERLPGKGWEFLPVLVSPEAYDQMYRFRLLIEPAAILEDEFSLPDATIARLRGQQQAMLDGGILRFSNTETFQIGAQFHEDIVSASRNPFFLDAIARMNRLRRLLEYRAHSDRSRLVQECKEHLELLDLIEAGQFKQASEFLRRHIDHARSTKLPLTRQPSAMLQES